MTVSLHSKGTLLLIASAGQACRPVPGTSQASPWTLNKIDFFCFFVILICYYYYYYFACLFIFSLAGYLEKSNLLIASAGRGTEVNIILKSVN